MDIPGKKKKDFKLREDIVLEFEALAPGGKQTQIVESLIADWVAEQKRKQRRTSVAKAYQRDKKARRK